MTHTIIYYITTMPTEAGVAAFGEFLSNSSDKFLAVGMTIDQAKEKKVIGIFDDTPSSHIVTDVIFLGNYWDSQLGSLGPSDTPIRTLCPDQLRTGHEKITMLIKNVIVYSFGNASPKDIDERVSYITCDNMGPAEFFLRQLYLRDLKTGIVEFACNHHLPALKIIDDRILQRNLAKTSAFLAGLYNYPFPDGVKTSFDRFLAYFKGAVTLEKIMEMGSVIVDAQQQMAAERVRTNSAPMTLKNGLKGVVTDAPDLINLTQDALQQAHPEVQVTLVASLKFGAKTSIAYSIRAMPGVDLNVHLGDLLKESIGGGGSEVAAGGRVVLDWEVPF